MTSGFGKLSQCVHQSEVFIREDLGAEAVLGAAGLGEGLASAILSCKQSIRDGEIGQKGNPQALALRENFGFGLAMHHTVVVLHAHEARTLNLCSLTKLCRGKIGASDLSHLA